MSFKPHSPPVIREFKRQLFIFKNYRKKYYEHKKQGAKAPISYIKC